MSNTWPEEYEEEELIYEDEESEQNIDLNFIPVKMPDDWDNSLQAFIKGAQTFLKEKQIDDMIWQYLKEKVDFILFGQDEQDRLYCWGRMAQSFTCAFGNTYIFNFIKKSRIVSHLSHMLEKSKKRQEIQQALACIEIVLVLFSNREQQSEEKKQYPPDYDQILVRIFIKVIQIMETIYSYSVCKYYHYFLKCVSTFKTLHKLALDQFRELKPYQILKINALIIKIIQEKHKLIGMKTLAIIVERFYNFIKIKKYLSVLIQNSVINLTLMAIVPFRPVFYELSHQIVFNHEDQRKYFGYFMSTYKTDLKRAPCKSTVSALSLLSVYISFYKVATFHILQDPELVQYILNQAKSQSNLERTHVFLILRQLIVSAVILKPQQYKSVHILSKGTYISDLIWTGVHSKDSVEAQIASLFLMAIHKLKQNKRMEGNMIYENIRDKLKKKGSFRGLLIKAKCIYLKKEEKTLNCRCPKKDCIGYSYQSEED